MIICASLIDTHNPETVIDVDRLAKYLSRGEYMMVRTKDGLSLPHRNFRFLATVRYLASVSTNSPLN